MMILAGLIFAFVHSVKAQTTANGTTTSSSVDTQSIDCNHPGGINGIDPSCWSLLNMTKYTQDWWSAHQDECGRDANFSTCFWELHNIGTYDCTGIKQGACPRPNPNMFTPRDFYIAYNIYAINQVFNSLYAAVGNANTLASSSIGAIVALINPIKDPTGGLLEGLINALTIGVQCLFPGAEASINKVIVKVTQAQPTVGRSLLPVGTTQSQVTQWANLANELATLVQRYQGNISSIIPATVNNITEFIDFASTGAFSVNPLPDASTQSDILVQVLNTFVIARAFTANNVVLTQAPDTDINELQVEAGDELAYDTGCGHGYDEYGICGPFWFDPRVKTTFSLDNLGEMTKDYHDDMHTIFSNWTTPDMLFGNAYRCAQSGGDANGPTIGINPDGSVEIDCLSDIKVCTWSQESLDIDKEFSDCPKQENFGNRGVCSGGNCGDSEGSIIAVNVPAGYAGIYLYGAPPNYCVCNT